MATYGVRAKRAQAALASMRAEMQLSEVRDLFDDLDWRNDTLGRASVLVGPGIVHTEVRVLPGDWDHSITQQRFDAVLHASDGRATRAHSSRSNPGVIAQGLLTSWMEPAARHTAVVQTRSLALTTNPSGFENVHQMETISRKAARHDLLSAWAD